MLLLCLLVFTGTVFSKSDIKIHTDLINERLVPSIVINGQTVLQLFDKGSFDSTFARAENIYSTLMDVDEKGLDIGKIRIRLYKNQHMGMVHKIKIFDVTHGDIIANGTTSYTLGKQWAANIKNAADIPSESSLNASNGISQKSNQFPLMSFFTVLNDLNFFSFLKYAFVFTVIQILITLYVVTYFLRKERKEYRTYNRTLHQVDHLQDTVSFLKESIKKLNHTLDLEQRSQGNFKEEKEKDQKQVVL